MKTVKNDTNLPPTILVIFGISGDLSHRYLLPALSEIVNSEKIVDDFKILGVSRRNLQKQELFSSVSKNLQKRTEVLQMDLESDDSYQNLKLKIEILSKSFDKAPQIIYYFVVAANGSALDNRTFG